MIRVVTDIADRLAGKPRASGDDPTAGDPAATEAE